MTGTCVVHHQSAFHWDLFLLWNICTYRHHEQRITCYPWL